MAASVKSGFSNSSSAYVSRCGPKPKDALVKVGLLGKFFVRIDKKFQVWKFCRRLLYIRQMDFQYALWQAHKLLINPQKLYQNFQYR